MQADYLVLYDGVCGLCHRGVQLILPRDPKGRFRFAPLQSDVAAQILTRHGQPVTLDRFWLVKNPGRASERLSTESRGVLDVLFGLGGRWRALSLIGRLVPRALGDRLYRRVAGRRYQLFGRADACIIPSAAHRGRFVGLQPKKGASQTAHAG